MKNFVIDFAIQPSKTMNPLDNGEHYSQIDFSFEPEVDVLGTRQSALNATSDFAETLTKSISGNLLDTPTSVLATIENYPITEIMDEQGVIEISHFDHAGVLTIYTKTLEDNPNIQKGDFLYVIPEGNLDSSHDEFSYQLQHLDGSYSNFTLSFHVHEAPYIGNPEDSRVDEAGLLPGDHEASETYGNLDIPFHHLEKYVLKFDPIQEQKMLQNTMLTSSHVPLVYELLEDGKVLQATQGIHGSLVFTVELHVDGSYQFKLHQPMDRDPIENLITDANFENITNSQKGNSGWRISHSDMFLLQEEKMVKDETIITQCVPTEHGMPYHLSFFQGCPFAESNSIEIYWNNNLLKSFQGQKNWTGYYFIVEGAPGLLSELTIVSNSSHSIDEYIRDFSLYSKATHQLPLEFSFSLMHEDLVLASSQFTVSVALESPLILQPTAPLNIIYEQGIYQSIVVQETNASFPLTTLDLEALFENLQIAQPNRQVNVVQLKEEGVPTPIYEIQLNDITQPFSPPITVADIRLLFEGGEGGLDVFFKNIQILDS